MTTTETLQHALIKTLDEYERRITKDTSGARLGTHIAHATAQLTASQREQLTDYLQRNKVPTDGSLIAVFSLSWCASECQDAGHVQRACILIDTTSRQYLAHATRRSDR